MTPYLRGVLGFIGIKDVQKVWINGTSNRNQLKTLIEKASQEAIDLLDNRAQSFTPLSAIEKLLKTYEAAINAKDIQTLVSLYSSDARLSINNFGDDDAVGADQLKQTWTSYLDSVKIRIYLEISDIVEYSGFAHASTRGIGTLETTQGSVNKYRENFVLVKEEDGWKISNHVYGVRFGSSK